jgi:hypothetical protein
VHGILTHCILDEPIVLNDDEESDSTQSEASEGGDEAGFMGQLDATPRDPTNRPIGDDFDLATQLLLSDLIAVHDCNNGAADDRCPPPNVGSAGELDTPPRDPTSELMDDGSDLATQLPLFNPMAVDNGNGSVTGGECPYPTKRQRSPSSCSDPTPDCDRPDKREDDYVFDIIATDDNEDDVDARSAKRRKLPAVSCRYPSLAGTIPKMQVDQIDRAQSPIAKAAAIQRLDLRSNQDYHREGIAERDGENVLRSPTNIDTADTALHLFSNAGDPQADASWEIREIIGKRTIDGLVQYWLDWEPTWMCESELEGA